MSSLLQLLARKAGCTSQTQCSCSTQQTSFEEDLESSAEAAGLDVDALTALKDQIKTAVTAAIENYDQSSGQDGLKEAVKTAIEDTLKANGFDPAEVESRLQTAMESMKGGMEKMGGMGMGPPPPPPGEGGVGGTDQSETESTTNQTLLDSLSETETDSDSSLLSLIQAAGNSQTTGPFDFSNILADIMFGLDVRA